jgi:hypothetical protein
MEIDKPEEKRSLALLLHKLQAMDDEIIEFDPVEHKMTCEDLKEKIDSINTVKNQLESRIAYHKDRIKEHKDATDSLGKSLERLKTWVQFCLSTSGTNKIQGNNAYVQLTSNKKVDLFFEDDQINSDLYAKYPDAIKRSFSWDKSHIKANIDNYSEIARIEQTSSIKFGVKK